MKQSTPNGTVCRKYTHKLKKEGEKEEEEEEEEDLSILIRESKEK